MNKQAIKELILNYTAGKTMEVEDSNGKVVEYSLDQIKETYLSKLNEIAGDVKSLRRNKVEIYELIEEMTAEILPKRVQDRFAAWADVESVPFGTKKVFKVKKGKIRGKRFITQVGPSGKFEAFRLDTDKFEVKTHMEGGAGYIDLFDFVRGHITLAEVIEVILEGLEDSLYAQLFEAIVSVGQKMPSANSHTEAGFNATEFRKLGSVVKAYGTGAVIYCFPEFADTIIHDSNFAYITDADKNDIREKGYLGKWFGMDVIVLENSFIDENNEQKVFDESKALIMPLGGNKPAQILFEGEPMAKEYENRGNHSTEFMIMQAFGIAVMHQNNYAIYENTDLA